MKVLNYIFLFLPLSIIGQEIPELSPDLGVLIDKSLEGEQKFNADRKACELVWEKMSQQNSYDNLTIEEQNIYDNCDESYENYWDILGNGCSWYCGGGTDSLTASSQLQELETISYGPLNAHDLSYQTAWVEGADEYGIGETLTYHFSPASPRVTEIIVVNGYVKTDKTWIENSRVKKLGVSVDGVEKVIFNLEDSKAEQHFKIGTLGYGEREDMEKLRALPHWTLTFEILEVYPGTKFDDTAITQIYFDGIDVH